MHPVCHIIVDRQHKESLKLAGKKFAWLSHLMSNCAEGQKSRLDYWPNSIELVYTHKGQFKNCDQLLLTSPFGSAFLPAPSHFSFSPCPLRPSLFFLSLPPPQSTPTFFFIPLRVETHQMQARATGNLPHWSPVGRLITLSLWITAALPVVTLNVNDTDNFKSCIWLFAMKAF